MDEEEGVTWYAPLYHTHSSSSSSMQEAMIAPILLIILLNDKQPVRWPRSFIGKASIVFSGYKYSRNGSGVGGSDIDYCLAGITGILSGLLSPGLQWVYLKLIFQITLLFFAPYFCLPVAVGHSRQTPPSLAGGMGGQQSSGRDSSDEAKRVQYVSKLRDCGPQHQQILSQSS
jgi:hypothetical protein